MWPDERWAWSQRRQRRRRHASHQIADSAPTSRRQPPHSTAPYSFVSTRASENEIELRNCADFLAEPAARCFKLQMIFVLKEPMNTKKKSWGRQPSIWRLHWGQVGGWGRALRVSWRRQTSQSS